MGFAPWLPDQGLYPWTPLGALPQTSGSPICLGWNKILATALENEKKTSGKYSQLINALLCLKQGLAVLTVNRTVT